MPFRLPVILVVALVFAALAVDARPQQEPADPAAQAPDPEILRAVRESLEAGRPGAQARVREAKEAVAAEMKEETERDLRLERALVDSTGRAPLRVVMSENLVLDGARVTLYSRGRVTLTWPQGEVEYPLELLPEEARGAILGIALSKANPRDHFELGKLLVRGRDFERAARCFKIAAERDPALAAFVPDLERVKRAARLFEGTFKAAGNTLGLRWGFGSAQESGDFLALQGTLSVRPGQGLEVEGPKIALTAVKEIPFRDRVRVSAVARESEGAAHLMGIRFVKPDGGEVFIYGALATGLKSFLVNKLEDGKNQELLALTPGATGLRMTMDFNRGRFSYQVGEKTVWSGNQGGFTDVQVVVGAAGISRAGAPATKASVQFKEVTLQGEVNPRWMTKKMAGLRDALGSELSKEHRLKRGGASEAGLELSVEAAVTRAPEPVRTAYQAALSKIATMRKSKLQTDLVTAKAALEELTTAHASFAPGWYYLGDLAELGGDSRAAGGHYERALALLPDFPEALSAVGRLRVLGGKAELARESVDRALVLKPDFAEGHLLRARLQWESRDVAGVLESTRLARRLAPSDSEIQSQGQMLANVARGPSWPHPNAHASAHYSVRSDLAGAKCKLYAEHLEGIRSHYEEVLGRSLPAGKPAEVLIFDSEEGYFTYSDFTAGDRLEHTLGAFSPWHGQMALFEGVDPAETLRVLSHEGFHQALHALAPDVPIWFNEGMAEYVGAARVEKGKVVERGGIQTGRLDNLKMAFKYGWSFVPFDQIMLESQSDFYGDEAPFNYAQAWSMIRYFLDGDGGRWKPVMKDYIGKLLGGDSAQAAYLATFAKQPLREMEAGWMKFYGLVPTAKRAKAGTSAGAAPPGPVDLLASLVEKGVPPGAWVLKGNTLDSPPGNGAPLDLGYTPPAEYDWQLSVQRTSGMGFLALGLQGGGKSFLLKLDDQGFSGLEILDGLPGRNATFRRVPYSLAQGQSLTLQCSVRKTGVKATIDTRVVVDWTGDLGRLSLQPNLTGGGFATKNLFLWSVGSSFRISRMSVTPAPGTGEEGPATPAAKAAPPIPPKIVVDAERSVALGCDISRWVVDEENGRIFALEPTANNLLEISIADRKVLRKISTGAEPAALCFSPGSSRLVWVGIPGNKSVVRIDVEKGTIVDTIQLSYEPAILLAVRKTLWCIDANSQLHGIEMSEKKDLGTPGYQSNFLALAYDSRKDRLWALGPRSMTSYDASRIGPIAREMSRKNLSERERLDLQTELGKSSKTFSTAGSLGTATGFSLLVDDKSGKVFFNRNVAKPDQPLLPGILFKPALHPLASDPAVKDFLVRSKVQDQFLALSPDGKWIASGQHIYNVATFAVHKELPLPTSLVAFSKDSKELCYFDWVNQVISVLEVEAK